MKPCLIFNPTARGEKARRFHQYLESIGSDCVLKLTTAPGSAKTLAAEAVRAGYRTVIAAGGDGTLNEVLNGIASEPKGLEQTALAVLPLGTVNVFAKEIRMPERLPSAWEVIRRGREAVLDLPFVVPANGSSLERRYFLQMAGAGLDARSIELVNWEFKKKLGQMAYVIAGAQALSGKQSMIHVRGGGHTASGELILIGNGRFYAGRIPIFHQADYSDGVLDVCVFPKVNWQLLPRYAWGFFSGQLFKPSEMRYFQASEIELTSESKAPVQVEGELAGTVPIKVLLQPKAIRVILP